jgi:hypothetical protein
MKRSYLLALFLLSVSSISSGTTYQLVGTRTDFYSDVPFGFELFPTSSATVSGSLDVDGRVAELNLTLNPRVYSTYNLGMLFGFDPMSLSLSSSVYADDDWDYGGYGSYYYEYEYSETYLPEQRVDYIPVTSTQSDGFIATSGLASVSVSPISFGGYERSYEYYYGDNDQSGTPDIYGYENTWGMDESFELSFTYYDFILNEQVLSEVYTVSIQEVPLPGAAWLFLGAVSGLFISAGKRRAVALGQKR